MVAYTQTNDIQHVFERDGMRTFLSVDVFMRVCGNYPNYLFNASTCGPVPGSTRLRRGLQRSRPSWRRARWLECF